MSHITNKVHDQSHRTRYIRLDAPAEIRHFAQIPSFLFDEPAFQPLTNEGKLLYTMLLRRSELSRKHRWTDKQGCIFIYYTIEETTELLWPAEPALPALLRRSAEHRAGGRGADRSL